MYEKISGRPKNILGKKVSIIINCRKSHSYTANQPMALSRRDTIHNTNRHMKKKLQK